LGGREKSETGPKGSGGKIPRIFKRSEPKENAWKGMGGDPTQKEEIKTRLIAGKDQRNACCRLVPEEGMGRGEEGGSISESKNLS